MHFRTQIILLCTLLTATSLYGRGTQFRTADGWIWKNPIPFGGDFYSVQLLSDQIVVVGGDYGVICRSTDCGESWAQSAVPNRFTAAVERLAFFSDHNLGYAIGGGRLLRTTNGGLTWNWAATPNNAPAVDICIDQERAFLLVKVSAGDVHNAIYSIHQDSAAWVSTVPSTAVFAGMKHIEMPYTWNDNTIFLDNDRFASDEGPIMDVTPTPDGVHCLILSDTLVYEDGFDNLLGSTHTLCDDLEITETGVIYTVGDHIYRSRNGGASFDDLGEVGVRLHQLNFRGGITGFAVGYNARIVFTVNSGNFWSNSLVRTKFLESIRNVYCVNANLGYLQSSDCVPLRTYRTIDGGDSWDTLVTCGQNRVFPGIDKFFVLPNISRLFFLDSTRNFYNMSVIDRAFANTIADSVHDFYFLNAQTGWYITDKRIYRSQDGGVYWNLLATFPNERLNAVFFVDARNGYLGGDQGTVLKSSDGGENWMDVSVAGVDVNGLCFISPDTGFVAADEGVFFKTINGGATWRPKNTGTQDDLHTLNFFTANIGYVVTSLGFIATTDGGDHFTTYVTPLGFEVGHTQKTPSLFVTDSTFSNFIYGRGLNVLVGSNYLVSVPPDGWVGAPGDFRILAAYPNPFNASTTIHFSLAKPGLVSLSVCDLMGREVSLLESGWQTPGSYYRIWNAQNAAAGMYLMKLEAGNLVRTSRVVLIK